MSEPWVYVKEKVQIVRILLLSNLYPPYIDGGAEIVAADFAAGLKRLGHEVLVLTSSYGLPKAQQDGNIWRILHFTPAVRFDRRRPLRQQLKQPYNYYRGYHYPDNAVKLCRIVSETKPDVLYIWEMPGIGSNSLLKVLPKLRIPIVFHMESYWWLYAKSPETKQSLLRVRWFKRWLIGNVPRLTWTSLIACSSTVKQMYVQAGLDAERIEVIYNGIDARFLDSSRTNTSVSEANLSSTKKVARLLFVGRLSSEKGVLVVLEALDLLINAQGKQDIHLNIFGSGDEVYVRELQDFLRKKNLARFVTFHGKVTQDELIRHYDDSDIMLVPSLWQEPFGLVVAEAMARELPVIASNVGGPAEIIEHGVNGLLVEPGNTQELASAITQLLEHSDEHKQLSKTARATVQGRFTVEENVKRVERHLLRAVQKGQVDIGAAVSVL